jgi:hypothetical protein
MRGWRESDLAPWAAMYPDPEVRQYLGPLLTVEQASAWVLTFQDDRPRPGPIHPARSPTDGRGQR